MLVCLRQSETQDMRLMRMNLFKGQRFQCVSTSCVPFMTLTVSNVRHCQIQCLDLVYCRAATFQQSNFDCQLFTNNVDANTNREANSGSVTMIIMPGTRLPPGL